MGELSITKDHTSVSILIPVHNGLTSGVEQCLESVFNQTYANKEIIVVDDFSNDGTFEFLKTLEAKQRENLRIIRHEKNRGLSQSWNDGISSCRGDLILLLQQDCSLVTPNTLAKGIEVMQRSRIELLVGVPSYEAGINYPQFVFELRASRLNGIDQTVNFTANKCDLIRKEVFEKIGFFSIDLPMVGQDWIFSTKIVKANIPRGSSLDFCYSNSMLGESSFSKVFMKEMNYSQFLIRIFLQIRGANAKKNTIGVNRKSRLLNISFPALFDLFLITFLLSRNSLVLDSIFIIALFWVITAEYMVFSQIDNSRFDFDISWKILYFFVAIVLDQIYFIGFMNGLFKVILPSRKAIHP